MSDEGGDAFRKVFGREGSKRAMAATLRREKLVMRRTKDDTTHESPKSGISSSGDTSSPTPSRNASDGVKVTVMGHKKDFSVHEILISKADVPGIKSGDIIELKDLTTNKVCFIQADEGCFEAKGSFQISVEGSILKKAGIAMRSEVRLRVPDKEELVADFVQVSFKDQFISRSDMFRFKTHIQGLLLREGKQIDILGMRALVKSIRVLARPGTEERGFGVITEHTKLAFRTGSANIFWLVQLSAEMWEFADDGEMYFEKAMRFHSTLLGQWKSLEVNHSLTVVYFARIYFGLPGTDRFLTVPKDVVVTDVSHGQAARQLEVDQASERVFDDVYKVVVENETTNHWESLLPLFKAEFFNFATELQLGLHAVTLSIKPRAAASEAAGAIERSPQLVPRPGWAVPPRALRSDSGKTESGYARVPSLASNGNFLEAINMCLTAFNQFYVDIDVTRTGQSITAVTAGNGVFESSYGLKEVTKARMMEFGVGCDLVSLADPPLHSVPLFVLTDPQSEGPRGFQTAYWIHLTFLESYDMPDTLRDSTPQPLKCKPANKRFKPMPSRLFISDDNFSLAWPDVALDASPWPGLMQVNLRPWSRFYRRTPGYQANDDGFWDDSHSVFYHLARDYQVDAQVGVPGVAPLLVGSTKPKTDSGPMGVPEEKLSSSQAGESDLNAYDAELFKFEDLAPDKEDRLPEEVEMEVLTGQAKSVTNLSALGKIGLVSGQAGMRGSRSMKNVAALDGAASLLSSTFGSQVPSSLRQSAWSTVRSSTPSTFTPSPLGKAESFPGESLLLDGGAFASKDLEYQGPGSFHARNPLDSLSARSSMESSVFAGSSFPESGFALAMDEHESPTVATALAGFAAFPQPKGAPVKPRVTEEEKLPEMSNPFKASRETGLVWSHNRRRWSHVFPDSRGSKLADRDRFTPNLQSLNEPAILPITSDHVPKRSELTLEFTQTPYTVLLSGSRSSKELTSSLAHHLALLREMVCQRLAHDFQLVTPETVEKTLKESVDNTSSFYLSMGHRVHRLRYDPVLQMISVVEFKKNPPKQSAKFKVPAEIKHGCAVWNPTLQRYQATEQVFASKDPCGLEWNPMDQYISDEVETSVLTPQLKYKRLSFAILPLSSLARAEEVAERLLKFRQVKQHLEGRPGRSGNVMIVQELARLHRALPVDRVLPSVHAVRGDTRRMRHFAIPDLGYSVDRLEWLSLFYDDTFDPFACYHLELRWVVCAGSTLVKFVDELTRKTSLCGLELLAVPQYAYSEGTQDAPVPCLSFPFTVSTLIECIPAVRMRIEADLESFGFCLDLVAGAAEIRSPKLTPGKQSYKIIRRSQYLMRNGLAFIRIVPAGLLWFPNMSRTNRCDAQFKVSREVLRRIQDSVKDYSTLAAVAKAAAESTHSLTT